MPLPTDLVRAATTRARGILGTLRSGHAVARGLAVADSRSFVRTLFLASAVRLDVLPFLRTPRRLPEIARFTDSVRTDRLSAWLQIGVELHELDVSGEHYFVRSVRARALAARDSLLVAHYRSMLDYQAGPYTDLGPLLRQERSAGRDDLSVHAAVIAEVSLAAAPFVIPFLDAVVAEGRPLRALDVGCGTGVYVQALLEADPQLRVDAIDLAPDVIAMTRARLEGLALDARADLHVGDVRDFAASSGARFGLVTLLNSVYYFDRDERVDLFGRLRALLSVGGELVVVTMATPGSVASAHLHFMLTCQSGAASLPEPGQIEADLATAGFRDVETCSLVPTEPFIGVRAS